MISLALFTSIGGNALITHNINANTSTTTNNINNHQTSNANLSQSSEEATLHINNSLQNYSVHNSGNTGTNVNSSSNDSNNKTNDIINEANNMHQNILTHAMLGYTQVKPQHALLGSSLKDSVPKPTIIWIIGNEKWPRILIKRYDEPRVDVGTYFWWTIVPSVTIIAIVCFVELYLEYHSMYFASKYGAGNISDTLLVCLQPGVMSYIIAFLISFLTKHTRNLNFFYKCFAIVYIICTIIMLQ